MLRSHRREMPGWSLSAVRAQRRACSFSRVGRRASPRRSPDRVRTEPILRTSTNASAGGKPGDLRQDVRLLAKAGEHLLVQIRDPVGSVNAGEPGDVQATCSAGGSLAG